MLLRTTKYYKVRFRTTQYYYRLLLHTTKHYSVPQSTTQYYSVLHCATPYYKVLHSTTPYYKVLQHSTTPYYKVLPNTTSYYTVLQSTAQYYSVPGSAGSTGPRGLPRAPPTGPIPARARGPGPLEDPTRFSLNSFNSMASQVRWKRILASSPGVSCLQSKESRKMSCAHCNIAATSRFSIRNRNGSSMASESSSGDGSKDKVKIWRRTSQPETTTAPGVRHTLIPNNGGVV